MIKTVITQDMVGLKIHAVKAYRTWESDEYNVVLRFKEISEEGLEVFGLTDDDVG